MNPYKDWRFDQASKEIEFLLSINAPNWIYSIYGDLFVDVCLKGMPFWNEEMHSKAFDLLIRNSDRIKEHQIRQVLFEVLGCRASISKKTYLIEKFGPNIFAFLIPSSPPYCESPDNTRLTVTIICIMICLKDRGIFKEDPRFQNYYENDFQEKDLQFLLSKMIESLRYRHKIDDSNFRFMFEKILSDRAVEKELLDYAINQWQNFEEHEWKDIKYTKSDLEDFILLIADRLNNDHALRFLFEAFLETKTSIMGLQNLKSKDRFIPYLKEKLSLEEASKEVVLRALQLTTFLFDGCYPVQELIEPIVKLAKDSTLEVRTYAVKLLTKINANVSVPDFEEVCLSAATGTGSDLREAGFEGLRTLRPGSFGYTLQLIVFNKHGDSGLDSVPFSEIRRIIRWYIENGGTTEGFEKTAKVRAFAEFYSKLVRRLQSEKPEPKLEIKLSLPHQRPAHLPTFRALATNR